MTSSPKDQNPFRLGFKSKPLARGLEKVLGLSRLAEFYDAKPAGLDPREFLRYTLSCFKTRLDYDDSRNALGTLPAEGPLLIIANHPLGGLEGVALAEMLLRFRPDLKVLTNELLTRIPELAPIFVGVDVLSKGDRSANKKGLLNVSRHLQQGGALLVFPAGKVAAYNFRKRRIDDHDWNRVVGHLVRKAKPVVCPIYVEGRNSRLFYAMAALHPALRALMLPRELSNKSGFQLKAHIGELVGAEELLKLDDTQAITHYLRLMTELAQPRQGTAKRYAGVTFAPLDTSPRDAGDQQFQLPAEQFLLKVNDDFAVYCAPWPELGDLRELVGQARELTFRAAGEGTGNAVDIDRFDPYYQHILIWDLKNQRVAGGYRIGRVDEIVAQRGIDALYSRTLYKFNRHYLDRLGHALEIGRSFVHPDYQRQSAVLDLLWKGIGQYVANNPEYHTLFGAVSISNEHSDLARALIAETMLESFRAEQRYLEDVRPVEPLKVSGRVWTREMLASLSHVSLINKLIGRCDPGKALPTLLRHYLSLNGRFVCFSVNKVFNDSLDGLIIVDLRETPQRYLNRYLGRESAERTQAVWRSQAERGQTA